jgi:hypothetical protein
MTDTDTEDLLQNVRLLKQRARRDQRGWETVHQTQVGVLKSLLLPAAVLLIGGAVAVLTERGATR